MKYTRVLNPQWANSEHTLINCEVDFDDLSEELVLFTAVANGDYEHTHQIFTECISGLYGEIAEYVAPIIVEPLLTPPPTKEELMEKLLEIQQQLENL